MNFYLGCAVWSYKGWVGNLYPPKSKSQDFLRLYSQHFSIVEGNTTFYAVPSAEKIRRWVEQTVPGFRFCPKFPQTVTHQGLLQPSISSALDFIERMKGLGDRLGIIFAQLPPSYSPAYLEDLTEFLTGCQNTGVSLAVEVRHLDWYKEPYASQLNQTLTQLNVGRVLLDTRPIYNSPDDPQANSPRKKPQLPLTPITTTDFTLVRFISHPQQQYNESFLAEWLSHIDDWLNQGKTIYFFVHCPLEENSPNTAYYLQNLLEQRGVEVSELPKYQSESNPIQLSLF
ncbi:MAG: DUF72 domain-containing protein [Xenococcaceae cyanobacterium MO_188.B32]|nr:DUF72 domain-containing protein [Xenococcaceae cyanobacterium MO_188.B32]